MTFPATWGCASDFLKMLPIFIIAARRRLQNFLWGQKRKNLKSEIFQILLSHSLPYGYVQVTFSRFTKIQNGCNGSTSIFWWALKLKNLSRKLVKFYYHIPHHMEM